MDPWGRQPGFAPQPISPQGAFAQFDQFGQPGTGPQLGMQMGLGAGQYMGSWDPPPAPAREIDDPILKEAARLYKEGKMEDGTIRKWEVDKGFGWIRPDGVDPKLKTPDVFIYQKELSTELKDRHFKDELVRGMRVMYNCAIKEGMGKNGKEEQMYATVAVCPSELRMLGILPPAYGAGKGSPVGVMRPNSFKGGFGPDRNAGLMGASRSAPYSMDEVREAAASSNSVRIDAAQMARMAAGQGGGTTVRVDASTVRVTGSADGQTVRITGPPPGGAPAAGVPQIPNTDPAWWATFMSALNQGTAPASSAGTAPASTPDG